MQLPMFAVCERPVFIVGAPRSGSSLMRDVLGQHPGFRVGEEGDFLQPVIEAISQAWRRGNRHGPCQWLGNQKVNEGEFWKFAGLGFNALYTSRAGTRRWVEKSSDYSHYMAALAQMFPGAQFIYMHRDGRQVVNSLCRQWGWSFRRACCLWRDYTRPILSFEKRFPQKIIRLCFEEFVARPETSLERVFRFLQEDDYATCMQYFRDQNDATKQIQGEFELLAEYAGPVRHKALQRFYFNQVCGNLQLELGYH